MSTLTSALPTANPAVVYRALPDGAVLFSTVHEVYFGLNESGAFIWEHLRPTCETLDELCAALCTRFPEVSAETARGDVLQLLGALADAGLVTA